MERHALEGGMMRVRLTGWYRVLWGTSYWNPYPSQTMDPNSHPDHKTNQPNNQPTNQPTALKTYSPFGLNTVPSPKDSGVTPFVITYSATAVEAAKLVKTFFNKLKAKHPNNLYKRCVTAFKRGQNLRDLLVRSRLGKAPLDNTAVTGSDSSQDLTTLVNALDEV